MAVRMDGNFSFTNENYLRSLVANATGDGDYADSLSYGELKRDARKIKKIANKILTRRTEELESSGLELVSQDIGKQLLLFS